jgi:hypothetical protein
MLTATTILLLLLLIIIIIIIIIIIKYCMCPCIPVTGAPPSSGGGSHRMVTTLGWLLGEPGTRCGFPGGHGGTVTV